MLTLGVYTERLVRILDTGAPERIARGVRWLERWPALPAGLLLGVFAWSTWQERETDPSVLEQTRYYHQVFNHAYASALPIVATTKARDSLTLIGRMYLDDERMRTQDNRLVQARYHAFSAPRMRGVYLHRNGAAAKAEVADAVQRGECRLEVGKRGRFLTLETKPLAVERCLGIARARASEAADKRAH
jgi:hypothetical protein